MQSDSPRGRSNTQVLKYEHTQVLQSLNVEVEQKKGIDELKKYAISKLTGRSRKVELQETQKQKVSSQVSKADSFEK